MNPSDRRGFGLIIGLAIFFVLLFSVAMVGVSRKSFTAAGDVRSGRDKSRARFLAQAVVEEMAWEIGIQANQPGSPVFDLFRRNTRTRELAQKGAGFELPTASTFKLPNSRRLAARDYGEFKIASTVAKVMRTIPYSFPDPAWQGDLFGTLILESSIQIPGARFGSSQVLAVKWLEFKVLRPTVNPPFDMMALTLVEPDAWANANASAVRAGAGVNAMLREAHGDFASARAVADRLMKQIVGPLQKDPRVTQIAMVADMLELMKGIEADIDEFETSADSVIRFFDPLGKEHDYNYFRPETLFYIMSGPVNGDSVNMPSINQRFSRIRTPRWNQSASLREALDAQVEELKEQPSEPGLKRFSSLLQQFRDAQRELLTTDREFLQAVMTLQKSFVHRVGPGQVRGIFGRYLDATRWGFALRTQRDGDGTALLFDARVTHCVEPKGDLRRNLLGLLNRYGPKFQGIVNVPSATDELTLSGSDLDLLGPGSRLAVHVRGNVTLKNLQFTGPVATRPLVWIICTGRMRVSGDIEASLASLGRYEPMGPVRIAGTLFLDEAGRQGGRSGKTFTPPAEPESILTGLEVRPDPRVRSIAASDNLTVIPSSYRVIFAPQPVYEIVTRFVDGREEDPERGDGR